MITDRKTGGPLPFGDSACASVVPANFPSGACADFDGHYTLDGLGPYDWPVEFSESHGLDADYAWQWSGNAADRASAELVPVRSGQTTTVDGSLERAGMVTGQVLNPDGTGLLDNATVQAFNTTTGDAAGPWTFSLWGGPYTLSGMDSQRIKIEYFVTQQHRWYLDERTFEDATPVHVVRGHTVSGVDLVLPAK